ncbi:MAG: hypothetical protein ACE5H0_10875 [Bacteroidota bacterium]
MIRASLLGESRTVKVWKFPEEGKEIGENQNVHLAETKRGEEDDGRERSAL